MDALNCTYRLKEEIVGPPEKYIGANVEKVRMVDMTWVSFKQFSERTVITMRNLRPHCERRRHATQENGAKCSHRTAGGPTSGAIPNRERDIYPRTNLSRGNRGANHPVTFFHTSAEDAGNGAVNANIICCSTAACPPILWRPWILHQIHQLSWTRRTRCATKRKLARWPKW